MPPASVDVVDGVPVPAGTSAPLDRPILLNNKISIVVGGVEIDPAFAGWLPERLGCSSSTLNSRTVFRRVPPFLCTSQ